MSTLPRTPDIGAQKTMQIEYDAKSDAMYLRLSDAKIADTDETEPGCMVDYDEAGRVVGIEILDFSERMKTLTSTPDHQRNESAPIATWAKSTARGGASDLSEQAEMPHKAVRS